MAGGLLLAIKGKPKGGSEEPDGDEDEGGEVESMKLDTAKELLAAVKSGDAQGVSDALSAHYDLCKEGYEESE